MMICVFLFISCSIQKRLYQDGYNIEWKNKKHNSEEVRTLNNSENEKIIKEEIIVPQNEGEFFAVVDSANEETIDLTASDEFNLFLQIEKKSEQDIFFKISEKKNTSTEIILEENDDEPKFNWLGLAGLIIAIIGFPFLGSVPSLIICWKALKQFKENPGKYKGKAFAITGFFLGLLETITLIIGIILFIIWALNGNQLCC